MSITTTAPPQVKLDDPKAVPFLLLCDYFKKKRVKLIVLENVDGIQHKVDHMKRIGLGKRRRVEHKYHSALDVVMNGIAKYGGKDVCIGLNHIDGYSWKVVCQRADFWRLPHIRKRLFFVGIRSDICGEKELDMFAKALYKMSKSRPGRVRVFLCTEEEVDYYQENGMGGRMCNKHKKVDVISTP